MTDCSVMRIDKTYMMQALHREHTFSDMFVAYLPTRNIRYEEDLVDQLFNSSEKRLARVLLLLAHYSNFVENSREEGRYAVVSSARLHPFPLLEKLNPEWLASRLEKILTKNVVLLYFDLPRRAAKSTRWDGLTSDTEGEIIISVERIAVVPANSTLFSPSSALICPSF